MIPKLFFKCCLTCANVIFLFASSDVTVNVGLINYAFCLTTIWQGTNIFISEVQVIKICFISFVRQNFMIVHISKENLISLLCVRECLSKRFKNELAISIFIVEWRFSCLVLFYFRWYYCYRCQDFYKSGVFSMRSGKWEMLFEIFFRYKMGQITFTLWIV